MPPASRAGLYSATRTKAPADFPSRALVSSSARGSSSVTVLIPEASHRREVASAPPFPIGISPPMPDSIQITLPDGSTKAAPAGIRVGDFVKESIGPGLAKAAVLARFNGKRGRPQPAAHREREAGGPHREGPRGAGHHPSRRRARGGERRAEALPGDPGHHRPDDRGRLLLRLLPRPAVHPRGAPGDRGGGQQGGRPERPLHPRGGERRRRHPPLPVQGREVQGRDHRGHRRQGRDDPDALPAR